ncbi:MAG: hypothetical protein CL678_00825 [Bdellovibrionaceae bacterium]|nr:hypothetical protein [Pseudobdellovibrionaceae bacterium]
MFSVTFFEHNDTACENELQKFLIDGHTEQNNGICMDATTEAGNSTTITDEYGINATAFKILKKITHFGSGETKVQYSFCQSECTDAQCNFWGVASFFDWHLIVGGSAACHSAQVNSTQDRIRQRYSGFDDYAAQYPLVFAPFTATTTPAPKEAKTTDATVYIVVGVLGAVAVVAIVVAVARGSTGKSPYRRSLSPQDQSVRLPYFE